MSQRHQRPRQITEAQRPAAPAPANAALNALHHGLFATSLVLKGSENAPKQKLPNELGDIVENTEPHLAPATQFGPQNANRVHVQIDFAKRTRAAVKPRPLKDMRNRKPATGRIEEGPHPWNLRSPEL